MFIYLLFGSSKKDNEQIASHCGKITLLGWYKVLINLFFGFYLKNFVAGLFWSFLIFLSFLKWLFFKLLLLLSISLFFGLFINNFLKITFISFTSIITIITCCFIIYLIFACIIIIIIYFYKCSFLFMLLKIMLLIFKK